MESVPGSSLQRDRRTVSRCLVPLTSGAHKGISVVVSLCSVVEVSVVGVVVKDVVARRRAGAFVYRSCGDSCSMSPKWISPPARNGWTRWLAQRCRQTARGKYGVEVTQGIVIPRLADSGSCLSVALANAYVSTPVAGPGGGSVVDGCQSAL